MKKEFFAGFELMLLLVALLSSAYFIGSIDSVSADLIE